MATYAIGDLQGCLIPFQTLLQKIHFNADRDRLWLVGDLVNRGPQSLETLRTVYAMRDNITCVLGNHDLHLLAVANGARRMSRGDTLSDILMAPDSDQLLEWIRSLPLLHHDKALDTAIVHAGIPPCWTVAEAKRLAAEVELVLRSKHLSSYLNGMYGNQPDLWQPHLEGTSRWRLITNYLTRMRFCSTDGQLELESKGDIDSGRKGFLPWFTHPRKSDSDPAIVFGHWAALEGRAESTWATPLDTGCVWGGQLTALRLEDKVRSSCDCAN